MNSLSQLQKEIERREKEVECLRELHAVAAKLTALYGPAADSNGNGNGNGKATAAGSKRRRSWTAMYPTPSKYKHGAYTHKPTLVNRVRVAMEKYGPMKLQRLAMIVKAPTKSVAGVVYNRPKEFRNIQPNVWGKR